MLAALTIAILDGMSEPKIEDLGWMTGRWECTVWGGIWEETWSDPKGGVMQSFARHLVDGKVAFLEFGTIEKAPSGLTHFLMLGSLTKEPKRAAFVCTSASRSEVTFEDPKNDFPSKILYKKVASDRMDCTLSGKGDPVLFAFKRVR
ncbi:MAG TPA: DUF6265 family protein [Fimbriimonadaceae bacterium]|nr:DUF6265 family protein [Fimbriimonadaceae bacterium]